MISRRFALLGLLLTGCASLPAEELSTPIDDSLRSAVLAGAYRLDPTTTQVNFTAGPTPAGLLSGQFKEFNGVLSVADAVDGVASLQASLDVSSAQMQSGFYRSILLGPGWFEVDIWSEARFEGKLTGWNTDGSGDVTGIMTIRDQSHQESFQFVLTCERMTLPCPEQAIGFSGQTRLDRTKYGMTHMQGLIGRDVRITVSGELVME